MRKAWITGGLLLGCVASAVAQTEWSAPQFGYVFHRGSHSLRPLQGYPGAAYIGKAVLSDIDSAYPSPDAKWVLSMGAESGQLLGTSRLVDPVLPLASFRRAVWAENSTGFAVEHCSAPAPDSETTEANECEWEVYRLQGAAWLKVGENRRANRNLQPLGLDSVKAELWFSNYQAPGARIIHFEGTEVAELAKESDVRAWASAPGSTRAIWFIDQIRSAIVRMEHDGVSWQESGVPFAVDLKDSRPLALRVLQDGTFVSIWKPQGEGRAILLSHDSQGRELDRQEVEYSPDQIGSAGSEFLSLHREAPDAGAVLLYDFVNRRILFVPERLDAPVSGEAAKEGLL